MPGDSKLLTLEEASEVLKKPEATLKRYARESLIRSVKENGVLMFPEDAVNTYLEISKRI